MKPVDVSKTTLPNRKAMNQLKKSPRSILDYSKLSPISQPAAPNMIANLAAQKGKV